MSSADHDRLSEVFLAAAELPPDKRAAFLDDTCRNDAELRAKIEALLRRDAHPAAVDDAINADEVIAEASAARPQAPPSLPTRLGDYEILGLLGQGGMGVVYRARQSHPKREVALKVINSAFVSDSLASRFEYEAQALGRLQHPGIAHIHEAGTFDEGHQRTPFYAMKLIEGQPLTEHAHARRLGIEERIELIRKVCDAVQHANQNGVIHRDLKPANILVDASGQPKILAFGVARIADSDAETVSLHTHAGQLLGTAPYMGPEQIVGKHGAVDTRSDVYALGLILYELLARCLPYDLHEKTIAEAACIIRDVRPHLLGLANRACRGDVETVVAKALEKSKELRYASVSDLAADLQRFLSNEPIVARPPNALYQHRKFARRNRVLVVGAAAMLVLLVAGIGGTSYGLLKATGERDEAVAAREALRVAKDAAEREAARALAVNTFLSGSSLFCVGSTERWAT